MPNGGQISAGSGLQLQATTPGNADTGNANISGTMIAKVFSTNPPNGSEKFGNGNNINGASVDSSYFGYGISAPLRNDNSVCFGYGAILGRGSGNTAVGSQSKAGDDIYAIGGNIAIGYGTRAGTNGLGSSTIIGNAVLGENAGRCVIITADANGYNFNGIDNSIIMGNNIGGRAYANSTVSIGTDQANVYIGVYKIGQSQGGTVPLADASYIMASVDGIVIMSTITASRTITLPPASSVPAGYIVKIADMSGSVTALITITAIPAGTDIIVGITSPNITAAYGSLRFMSNGVGKWNIASGF